MENEIKVKGKIGKPADDENASDQEGEDIHDWIYGYRKVC